MRDRVVPYVLGRGTAGEALAHALALYREEVAPVRWLERGEPWPAPENAARALAVIANPHALHAPRLAEAVERGFRYAICEKPAAVDSAQAARLGGLPIEAWVCHGYRMLWGPREIGRAWRAGRLGSVISVEGRYWQSSATHERSELSWKDDAALAGHHDVLLDLGTHWADLVVYLVGRMPTSARVRRWYLNATSPHRDTHVHLDLDFDGTASHCSVSKTAHGRGNTFEMHVVGEDAVASWSLNEPDVVTWGQRGVLSTQPRVGAELPGRPVPFHGLGWMEGYVRLVGEVVNRILYDRPSQAPTLPEHLAVLDCLLSAADKEAAIAS